MGTSKLMVLVPLFYLESLGKNSPLAVQGLQIGGTSCPAYRVFSVKFKEAGLS
jgi:hypothetical protein